MFSIPIKMGIDTLVMVKYPADAKYPDLLVELKRGYYLVLDEISGNPTADIVKGYERLCKEDPRSLPGDGGKGLISYLANVARGLATYIDAQEKKVHVVYYEGQEENINPIRQRAEENGFSRVEQLDADSIHKLVEDMKASTLIKGKGSIHAEASVLNESLEGFLAYLRIVLNGLPNYSRATEACKLAYMKKREILDSK